MTLEAVSFEGHDCVRLADEGAEVFVTTSLGPRVLGLTGSQGNLFAVLPDAALDRGDGSRFRLIGGHRLWAAPEVPEISYEPDDRPCAATEVDGGVRVEAPADGAGLVKSIEIRRADGGWTVDHTIGNASGVELTIAPWAVTQLRPGGEAILPLGANGRGLQADRSLVLWPYTDLADPRLTFERDAVRLRAGPGPAVKIGAAPGDGAVRFQLGRDVFEKRTEVWPGAAYADCGAAVQVYVCDEFCELETLGPLRTLGPGEEVTHRERWTLRRTEDGEA